MPMYNFNFLVKNLKKSLTPSRLNNEGFTLIELLIATAITGVVLASVYSVFYSQHKSYVTQNQIAGMQQNLRAAIFFIEREVRTVGCNPNGNADAGIQAPLLSSSIHLTMDVTDNAGTGDADGDVEDDNEDVTYSLSDFDGDGDNDLLRNTGVETQLIAENIDWIDFTYLDKDGVETPTISEIRSVQITLVAKSGKRNIGYVDTKTYTNKNNNRSFTPPSNDSFRRRQLLAEVQCRNLWF